MDLTVKVEGLQQLEDTLSKMGLNLARSAMRKALDVGGDVFVARAKALAPVLTKETPQRKPGDLRNAITKVIKLNPAKQSGRARVGPAYNDKPEQDPAVYALFLEFGTKKMAAQPFMRPAYDEAKQEAERVFTDTLRAGVARLEKRK